MTFLKKISVPSLGNISSQRGGSSLAALSRWAAAVNASLQTVAEAWNSGTLPLLSSLPQDRLVNPWTYGLDARSLYINSQASSRDASIYNTSAGRPKTLAEYLDSMNISLGKLSNDVAALSRVERSGGGGGGGGGDLTRALADTLYRPIYGTENRMKYYFQATLQGSPADYGYSVVSFADPQCAVSTVNDGGIRVFRSFGSAGSAGAAYWRFLIGTYNGPGYHDHLGNIKVSYNPTLIAKVRLGDITDTSMNMVGFYTCPTPYETNESFIAMVADTRTSEYWHLVYKYRETPWAEHTKIDTTVAPSTKYIWWKLAIQDNVLTCSSSPDGLTWTVAAVSTVIEDTQLFVQIGTYSGAPTGNTELLCSDVYIEYDTDASVLE